MVRKLSIDFETYSAAPLKTVGAYRYAQDPTTEVLILCWCVDHGPVRAWVPQPMPSEAAATITAQLQDVLKPIFDSEAIPAGLLKLIEDDTVEIHSHNSQFESVIWEYVVVPKFGAPHISPYRWRCSAAMAAAAGLPRSLEKVGAALQLSVQKDREGPRLIGVFCKPRKPTKLNLATRTYPHDRPEEFAEFISYCRTDVLAEMDLLDVVPSLSESEWRVFGYDSLMNWRGLPLDLYSVQCAFDILQVLERRVQSRVRKLTGGINPTQRDKMLTFLNELLAGSSIEELENLQAKTIKDLLVLKGNELPETAIELLQLRIEGGKASTKKLKKMLQVVCDDGRVRGGFLYSGASTGRWSGKLIQPQNFMRGEYKAMHMEVLFWSIIEKNIDAICWLFEWPIDALAQALRGFIRAPDGKKFVVCDFSAIEARVLAWLAAEKETVALYFQNADLYRRLAVRLYKLDHENQVSTPQRKFAKDIVLGCGFQLGGPGFQLNCFRRGIVIELEEAKRGVAAYRENNPNTVKFWYDVERCAIRAVETDAEATNPVKLRNLAFYVEAIWFCIRLPSSRVLRYPYPRVENTVRFNRPTKKLTYRSEVKGKWVRENTYGGKLVENIVQATARDIMVEAWIRAEERGYAVVGTVHDELITEVDEDFGSKDELEEILRVVPVWAKGAPINAEGWAGKRYRK